MGYADGYYYGQGRIICDTSTFSVGDTIRVRSMTDSSKVWNQQVATVGTALVFTVPPYDYYKICTVQDIGGVATEVGGVYKTVDFGQTLFINVLDKTTLGGIQGILNAHQEGELLAIGDEVGVTINGVVEPYILLHINGYADHEAIFGAKYLSDDAYASVTNYSGRSALLDYFNTLYAGMAEADKQYIKGKDVKYIGSSSTSDMRVLADQKIWLPTRYEILGLSETYGNVRFSYFVTQANRVKSVKGGNNDAWQSATSDGSYTFGINSQGAGNSGNANRRVLPCFHLTADS